MLQNCQRTLQQGIPHIEGQPTAPPLSTRPFARVRVCARVGGGMYGVTQMISPPRALWSIVCILIAHVANEECG
jgi:hypothetical protein